MLSSLVTPKIQLPGGFKLTPCLITFKVIVRFTWGTFFKVTLEMIVDVVCLSISASVVPQKFEITEVTEDDLVRVSIELGYVRAKLEEYNTFLEMRDGNLLVDGVKTLNVVCDAFNGMYNLTKFSFATS